MSTPLSEANIQARTLLSFQVLVHIKLILDNPDQAKALKNKLRQLLDRTTYDDEASIPHDTKERECSNDAAHLHALGGLGHGQGLGMGLAGDTVSITSHHEGDIQTKPGHIVNPFLREYEPAKRAIQEYPEQYKVSDVLADELANLDGSNWKKLYGKLQALLMCSQGYSDPEQHHDTLKLEQKHQYDFVHAYASGSVHAPQIADRIDDQLQSISYKIFDSAVFSNANKGLSLTEREFLYSDGCGHMVRGIFTPVVLVFFTGIALILTVQKTASLEAKDVFSTVDITVPIAAFVVALALLSYTSYSYGSALKNEAKRGSEKYMNTLYAQESTKIAGSVSHATAKKLTWPEQNAPVSKLLTAHNFIARSCGADEIPASKTGMRQGLV